MRARWLLLGAAVLPLWLGSPQPAGADELAVYVVLSCDAKNDRALLRFGYADDNDLPVFLPLPDAPADDFSREAVPDPRRDTSIYDPTQEVSCRFGDGRDLKARLGFGPASVDGVLQPTRWMFSVWLGGRKIMTRAPLAPLDCGEDCAAHSVLIDRDTLRRCDYAGVADGKLLDLAARPARIACAKPMDLVSVADPIEYPPAGTPAPPAAGAMAISPGSDNPVCRALVLREPKTADLMARDIPSDAPAGNEIVSLSGVGGAFVAYEPASVSGFNGRIDEAVLDFANDGTPRRVFRISGDNHYFGGELFVASDLAVPEGDAAEALARELSPEGSVDNIPELAAIRGWLAASGADTPYRVVRYTHFALFRFAGATYLIAFAGDLGDPSAVVLKPTAPHSLRTVCVLQTVRPNL